MLQRVQESPSAPSNYQSGAPHATYDGATPRDMSKRAVAFTKPEEPSFLKRIKEQVGYKEGPTVDTKKADARPADAEDFEDTEEERPTVVVLRPGDLTAEEADNHIKLTQKEEEEKKADLSAPIVFKNPKKKKDEDSEEAPSKKKKKSSKSKSKALLSFDEDEEDC